MQLDERKALVGFIAEIEASRERAKGETRHQSEIFKKAKEKGLDSKAMRKVLTRRAMSAPDREREDDLIDQYEHAMGSLRQALEAVQSGMPAREAAEKYNVPRGALGVLTRGSKNEISEPAHDADGAATDTSPKAPDASSTVTARATEPRSPAISASDSTEPVVPTGNEGRAGERGTSTQETDDDRREGSEGGGESDEGPREQDGSNGDRVSGRHPGMAGEGEARNGEGRDHGQAVGAEQALTDTLEIPAYQRGRASRTAQASQRDTK